MMKAKAQGVSMHRHEYGLTLVELMVSMTLGLMIAAIGMSLLLSARSAYVAQDENLELQENARMALELIGRAVRQAGYQNWGSNASPVILAAYASPDIVGLDAHSLKSGTPALEVPSGDSINASDVLGIRFFGAEDGALLNCAGFAINAPVAGDSVDERGWSIFYVAADALGETELRCKYKGKTGWTSEAIARGVESFQVLYGIDSDADGLPNQFLTASAIDALDDGLVLDGPNAVARALERSAKTNWKKVVSVKVALLVRGSQNSRADMLDKRYALFGQEYCNRHALSDKGVCLDEEALPAKVRNRARRIFTATFPLHNRVAGLRA